MKKCKIKLKKNLIDLIFNCEDANNDNLYYDNKSFLGDGKYKIKELRWCWELINQALFRLLTSYIYYGSKKYNILIIIFLEVNITNSLKFFFY